MANERQRQQPWERAFMATKQDNNRTAELSRLVALHTANIDARFTDAAGRLCLHPARARPDCWGGGHINAHFARPRIFAS